MWKKNWRDSIWSALDQHFDLIIIGGGITGGGIFLEASRAGLKTLLLEAGDFASGTSSRSSKLVHGGIRYLKNRQFRMTYESVHERERLLREGRGLITQIGFIIASYKGDRIPAWALGLGLSFYDLLALKWSHQYYPAKGLVELCPQLNSSDLLGGYRFFDAITDDARLVLRIIREGVRNGGIALNYARVIELLATHSGEVSGVVVEDMALVGSQRTIAVQADSVINATGAWADDIRGMLPGSPGGSHAKTSTIRKLRGSHLIIPSDILSLTRSINIWHPRDRRPVFFFPWEGVTIAGTTDVDHDQPLETNPSISSSEADYLLEGLNFAFPSFAFSTSQVLSTYSGIRAVVDTGNPDPSKESREHILWLEDGLLTVSGGKLTTFRLMALQALKRLRGKFPAMELSVLEQPVLETPQVEQFPDIGSRDSLRLLGRMGKDMYSFMESAYQSELTPIESTANLWAELRWAAREEGVVHLDDLLLRRLRLGLILPDGGQGIMQRVKMIVQEELGWTDGQWDHELSQYSSLVKEKYSLHTA